MNPSRLTAGRDARPQPGHILVAGFMGTGKSTVGAQLAAGLGLPFVDLDDTIARSAGSTLPEIFANEGEAGFRARERLAVGELATLTRSVVALGGWAVGDLEIMGQLRRMGTLVCLAASPATLADRFGASATDRPLLHDRSPAAIASFLAARQATYDAIPLKVHTDSRSPEQVTALVLDLLNEAGHLEIQCLPLATDLGSSRILIGSGLLDRVGILTFGAGPPPSLVALVADALGEHHGFLGRARRGFERCDVPSAAIRMGMGEAAKTLSTVEDLATQFLRHGVDRQSLICAVGGGVVGDTVGFAAATFMRGVPWVAVPTTLVAMVDAAIGGKTAVNLAAGKNLVGAFWPPRDVYIDPQLLVTMPADLIRHGLAEIAKVALVGDDGLWDRLAREGAPDPTDVDAWTDLIGRAVAIKVKLVEKDALDLGARLALNLGHTFAHALETASHFAIAHGDAVAVGLVAASQLSERLGHAPPGLGARVRLVLSGLGLPTVAGSIAADDVLLAMANDKKRMDGRRRFVLPRDEGKGVVITTKVSPSDLQSALEAVLCTGS